MAVISVAAGVPSGLADRLTGEVLSGLEATLQRLAASPDDWLALLSEVFDARAAGSQQPFSETAERLRQEIGAGAFSIRLELRSSQELQGAFGAYTADAGGDGERIYLNADWVATASDADVQRVLLEELGHAFDQWLNSGQDTPGDEGEAFAATVLWLALTPAEQTRISLEDDSATLTIDGQAVRVERSTFTDVSGAALDFSVSSDDVRIAGSANVAGETWLYRNVITINSQVVDAIVRFNSITGGSMTAFDSTANPYSSSVSWGAPATFLQPNFDWNNGINSANFTVSFIAGGSYNASTNPTGTAVTLRNVFINSYDLDATSGSNGLQYTSFSNIGGLELSSSTNLSTSVSGATTQIIATGSPGNITDAPGTAIGDRYRVRVSYDELSTLTFTVGAGTTGGTTAFYALDFSVGPTFNSVANYDLVVGGNAVVTSESGTTAAFTLVLSAQPSANVTVALTGLDTTEGQLSTTSLTFTSANWNTPQSVTVTGLPDGVADGNISYTLRATTASTDARYQGRQALIDVVNQDVAPLTPVSAPVGTQAPVGVDSSVRISSSTYVFRPGDFAFTDAPENNSLASVRISSLPTFGSLRLGGRLVSVGDEISLTDLSGGNFVYRAPSGSQPNTFSNPSFTFQVRDNGASNTLDQTPNTLTVNFVDTDGDGVRDVWDQDDDNDGILDVTEQRRSNTTPITASSIDFVYAQNAWGFQSFHSAALVYKTGDRNDPAFLFDDKPSTELRVHTNDIYEFSLKRTVSTGSSFTLEEADGGNDAACAVLGSNGTTDPTSNTNNSTGGGLGWATIRSRFNRININGVTYPVNSVTDLATLYNANGKQPLVSLDGQSILFYAGPSDSTQTFTTDIPITHFQIVGLAKHGGWSGLSLTAEVDESLDTDGDGIINRLDLDSDNDGISDLAEAVGWDTSAAVMVADANRDGTLTRTTEASIGANGVWSGYGAIDPIDSDSDGNPDFLDLDADNDGIPDTVELRPSSGFAANDGDVRNEDADGDGIIARFDANDSSGSNASFGGSFTTPVNTDASGESTAFTKTTTGFVTGYKWPTGGEEWKGAPKGSPTPYVVLSTRNTGRDVTKIQDNDGVAKIKSSDKDRLVLDFGKQLAAGTTISFTVGGSKDKTFSVAKAADASGGVTSDALTYTIAANDTPQDFTYTVPSGGLHYLTFNYGNADYRLDYVKWTAVESQAGKRTPDYLDRDSDGDGLLDSKESGLTLTGKDLNKDGIDDNVLASYQDPDGRVSDLSVANPFNTLTNADVDPSDVDYRSINTGRFNVSNVTVNEGSPWAVFSISRPGSTTSSVKVSLSNASGDTLAGTRIQSINDTSGDIKSTWQFLNSSGNWVNGSGGSILSVPGTRPLLVRVGINNDVPAVFEGPEQFRLRVVDASTNALVDASGGFGTILDDGTGDYWLDTNNTVEPDSGQLLDDDRKLVTIDDQIVNEGTGTAAVPRYAVFTLTGNAGQVITELDLSGVAVDASSSAATARVGTASIDLPGGSTDFGGTNGLQYLNASGTWINYNPSGSNVGLALDADGQLAVRVAIYNDNILETTASRPNGESFRLIATYTDYSGNAGAKAGGTGWIRDDGNGDRLTDANGDIDDISDLDDDSPISIPNLSINEASSWAVLDVEGKASQTYTLSLAGLTATLRGPSGALDVSGGTTDFGGLNPIQFLNASGNWVNYDGSSTLTLDATGEGAIRVRIFNDTRFEGASGETFRVTATSNGVASTGGIVTIKDDGTSIVFDASGNADPSGAIPLDDDRPLTVSGRTYNEASPYIFWTVTGASNQFVRFIGLDGTPVATALPNGDLSGALQYRDPSGVWRSFDASNPAQIDASGSPLLIRKAIVNDLVNEGKEDFRLTVQNTGGTSASGTSSVIDDGTGFIPQLNASGSPTGLDGSGNPSTADPSGVLNDDRGISVTGIKDVSEGSAAIFTVTLTDGNTRNTEISLSLADGSAFSTSDYGPGFTAYYYNGVTQVPLTITSGKVTLPAGVTSFYVKVLTTNDDPSGGSGIFEGLEDFQLTAQITGGKSAADTSIILDDGTGRIYDDKGLNPVGPGNNDRKDVTVTGGTFNENSPWAIYKVTGVPDGSGTTGAFGYTLSFSDLTTSLCPSGSQPRTLFSTNGGSTWQVYTPGSTIRSLGATQTVLVAVDITAERDAVFESTGPALETLVLQVQDSRDGDTAAANALILDNAQGDLIAVDASGNPLSVDASGNPTLNLTSLKDDDRPLTVTGQVYNEASPYLFWTVSGNAGQVVRLVGLDPDSSGAVVNGDLSGNLQYLNASGVWQTFDASTNPVLDGSGTPLLVRKAVVNDSVYEGLEHFRLVVSNTGGVQSSGRSSLIDDGTGLIPLLNGSGTPSSDGSGGFTDTSGVRDDDRVITVSGGTYNEASSRALFTVVATSGQLLTLDVRDVAAPGKKPTGQNDASGSGDSLTDSPIYVSTDGGQSWTLYSGPFSAGTLSVLVAVDITRERDGVFEGEEQFQLVVNPGQLTQASGFSSIVDNGSGLIPQLDGSGNPLIDSSGSVIPNNSALNDDDRPLTLLGATYNEASPFIFWTVLGAANQVVRFNGLDGDSSGALPNSDLTGALQYRDPAGVWRTFDASNNALIDASGSPLLVRKAVVNDGVDEGKEDFRLIVSNAGGTSVSANSSLIDNGSGILPAVDPSGNPTALDPSGVPQDNSPAPKDDDRPLTVTGQVYNESSPYLFWTVSGNAGQVVQLVGLDPDSSGAAVNGDLSGNLQYLNASGVWQTFDASTNPVLDGLGTPLLVRKAVVNDNVFEGLEHFRLGVSNTGGVQASGRSSLIDDGTGLIPLLNGSGTPSSDGSGGFIDTSGVRDDDRPLAVSGGTYNEASQYLFWTVTGAANQVVRFGGLDGDPSGAALPNGDLSGALQYRDPSGVWRSFDASNPAQIDASGSPLLIRKAIVNDLVYEGKEDFLLTVQNTGGSSASGSSSIIDDGTGFIPQLDASGSPTGLDGSGNPSTADPSGVLNDDRGISVTGIKDVSEGSAAIFTVTLTDGNTRNTEISLSLADGSAFSTSDYGPGFTAYYYNGVTQVPLTITSGKVTLPAGVTSFYVKVLTTNDDPSGGSGIFEGPEDFQLTAQITGGKSASDTSIILDDGTGKIYDDKGLNPAGPGNNDRVDVAVTGGIYNENSPWAIYKVTGVPDGSGVSGAYGYTLSFSDLSTSLCPSGSQPRTLFSTNGGASWQVYTPGSTIRSLGATQTVLVAVDITAERDAVFESTGPALETLVLQVQDSRDGDTAAANALILDNAQGDLIAVDASGNPLSVDASGNPTLNLTSLKDDDRPLTVTGQVYNEASPYLFWSVSGNAGQVVRLVGLDPDSSGAAVNGDLSGNLQYLNASGVWQTFDASTNPVLDGSGTPLLVRRAVVNDSVYEGLEHFRLVVSNTGGVQSSGRSSLIDDGTGLIPLLNGSGTPSSDGSGGFTDTSGVRDDDRSITVTGKPDVSEGSKAIFTVTLSANPSGTEVSLSLGKDGDSALGLDYSAITAATAYFFDGSGNKQSLSIDGTGKLSLPAGVSSFFVSVPTTVDAVYEGPESFTLTATAFGGDKSAFGSSTILDDGSGSFYTDQGVVDPSGGPIDDDRAIAVAGRPNVSEGSPAIFTVTLSGNPSGAVVSLSLGKPGDTAESTDYSALTGATAYYYDASGNKQDLSINSGTGEVTLPAGVTSFFVCVPTTVDAVYEGAEAFTLTATAFGGKSGSGSSTILDDGTGKFYTAQGEVNPSGGTPDDDRPTIRVSTMTLTENQGTVSNPSGFAIVDVSLDKQSDEAITFTPFLTAGTASNPADFGPTLEFSLDGSGWSSVTGPISFTPGSQVIKLRTSIVDDSIFDPNEQFTVNTGLISSGTVKNPSGAAGTVTIQDNDPQSLGTLSVTTKSTGNETGAVPNVFTFTRSNADLSNDLVIPFSLADSTAKLTTDFTTPTFSSTGTFNPLTYTGTITIRAGQSSAVLTVPTVNNSAVDGNRSVVARLSPVSGYTISPAIANGVILDNDVLPSVPVITVGNGTVVETNNPQNRTLNIAISLDRILNQDVTIQWKTTNATDADVQGRQGLLSSALGTAKGDPTVGPGTDYRSGGGQLLLRAGVQSVFISIPLIGDQTVEDDELFYVEITDVSVGGASLGVSGKAKGEVIIVDNDAINDITLTYANTSTSIDLRGGTGNDNLTGSTANDLITGHEGNDTLQGLDGADQLTGSTGADVFVYANTQHSTLRAMDSIRDLVAGNSSLGDRLRFTGDAAASRPTALFNASRTAPVVGLEAAIAAAFADKNLAQAGDQKLEVGEAVIFTSISNSQAYSYLAVNLGNAAFEAETDFLVQITGWNSRSFATGALSVNDFFS